MYASRFSYLKCQSIIKRSRIKLAPQTRYDKVDCVPFVFKLFGDHAKLKFDHNFCQLLQMNAIYFDYFPQKKRRGPTLLSVAKFDVK